MNDECKIKEEFSGKSAEKFKNILLKVLYRKIKGCELSQPLIMFLGSRVWGEGAIDFKSTLSPI